MHFLLLIGTNLHYIRFKFIIKNDARTVLYKGAICYSEQHQHQSLKKDSQLIPILHFFSENKVQMYFKLGQNQGWLVN